MKEQNLSSNMPVTRGGTLCKWEWKSVCSTENLGVEGRWLSYEQYRLFPVVGALFMANQERLF